MSTPSMVAGVPQGIGMYAGRGGITGARAAQLVRLGGVRHLGLCAEAVDGWRATPGQLREWGSVCRGEGLTPHVYGFPGLERARQPRLVATWLLTALRLAGGVCPIPDLEAAYRGRPQLLEALFDALIELCTDAELEALMITTFGLPSDHKTTWPWAALAAGIARARARAGRPAGAIGWQCYERAADDDVVSAGIAELATTWGRERVVPHLASYRRRSETVEGSDGGERLEADLERACLDKAGKVEVAGAWIWWALSTSRDELRVLRAFAQRVGW